MYTESEGIILRQIKAANGRRMVVLFSKKYGKISAGSNISEKGKSRAALAMRPFTFGRYDLFRNRDSSNINRAEVIRSFYRIGENVDKYMCASYVLEFTDKLLMEEHPAPRLFDLLIDFFSLLEERKSKYETLVSAYQVKAMDLLGFAPQLERCVLCGDEDISGGFSVRDGGVICKACSKKIPAVQNVSLIFPIDIGTISILKYFLTHSLRSLEKIGLEDELQMRIRMLLRRCTEYHLGVSGLKSESFFDQE